MTEALEPFAKAYLGMYYQLDNSVPPLGRVEQLSGGELYAAIIDGFENALSVAEVPSPERIGETVVAEAGLGTGYILLAALEEWCARDPDRVLELREEVIQAVLCYQFAHGDYQHRPWLTSVLGQSPQLVVSALMDFWKPYLQTGKEVLPGLNGLLKGRKYPQISGPIAIGLLQHWQDCDPYTLRRLLHTALVTGYHDTLREIARQRGEGLDAADIKSKIYWLATAYLLDPEANAQVLAQYAGRTKEKVLRLMDFSVAVLMDDEIDVSLSAMELAHLLRIIAPIIVRNESRSGRLDEDSSKVLWLFDVLRNYPRQQRNEAVEWLSSVRVMRAYVDILESLRSS